MEALPHEISEQRIRAARFTYCPSSSFEFSVRLQNVLCVSEKWAVRSWEKGCYSRGLFVYQTAVMSLPKVCDFSNGQV